VRAERGPGEGDSGEPGGSPAPEHPVEPEEAPKETLWKRELSFAPTAEESVVEEPVAEVEPVEETEPEPAPPVAEEPVAAEPEPEPVVAEAEVPEPEPWDAEPVLPPALESEAPIVVHPPVPAAELPELVSEDPKVPFWKKDISFRGKK